MILVSERAHAAAVDLQATISRYQLALNELHRLLTLLELIETDARDAEKRESR